MAKDKATKTTDEADEPSALTMEEILESKKPNEAKVPILLDIDKQTAKGEAVAKVTALGLQLRRSSLKEGAKADLEDELAEAEAHLTEATKAAELASVDFVLRALGRNVFETLQKAHKPTAEEEEEFAIEVKKLGQPPSTRLTFSMKHLPPVLIAKCCVSPKMTVDQAKVMWNSPKFSQPELTRLFAAAWRLCSGD